MYVIVKASGHQFRVAEGDEIEIDRLDAEEGDTIEFDEVLLVGGDDVRVGTPFVDGAVVKATVLGESKGPKLTVMRYKSKNRYRRQTGHRQKYTRLKIESIKAP